MFVRVVLDTSTVRNHTDDVDPKLDLQLINQKRDLVRISLAASTFVELTRQLADENLAFANWKRRLPDLASILDNRWPCLPNGKELGWLAQTQTIEPITSIEDESRYMRACWQHLMDVEPDKIGRSKVVYRVSDGSLKSICLNYDNLEQIISDQRMEWIGYIRKMQAELPQLGIDASDETRIIALMHSNLGKDFCDAPGLSNKLDAVSRMTARFVAQSLNSNKPAYNPEIEKRRGDAFDLNLLFYVPLPAVIVTNDIRFVRGLRETATPHHRQVLTIEEFNSELLKENLASLVRDFQTPDRQSQMQSDAAYFRWIAKGRRTNNDWGDWFASEPVA